MPERVYTTPLLDKLGVNRPGLRVALVDGTDRALLQGLAEREAQVVGVEAGDLDLVFAFARTPADLAILADLRRRIRPAGAIWVLRPKGGRDLRDVDVIDGALAHGLVDNKIASFSDTVSAMRLVIRVRDRR